MIAGQVVDLDRAAAERRAERISLRLDAIADNYTAVMPMIRESIAKRDDIALGYRSVSEYVADRFGGALSRLGVDVRREVVRELTTAGMSTRAIAPVVGVSKDTVHRDALSSGVSFETPGQGHITGGFHPDPARPTPMRVNRETGEITDSPERSRPAVAQDAGTAVPRQESAGKSAGGREATPHPPASRPSVTGLDGKTYNRPAPKAPPRRPLPDQFFDAAYDMGRAIEKVARIAEDDRFPQNAEKVAAKHRNDLLRCRDLLQQVIDALPTQEDTHD